MEARLQNLLRYIIKEYIATAEPVGSQVMVKKYFKELSPATIRNDMAELESQALIFQPHISAGRLPTEDGWQYYLKNLVANKEVTAEVKKDLKQLLARVKSEKEVGLKDLAKHLAEVSQNAILVGFGPHDVYYTGLANLFSQPEFSRQEVVYNVSMVIDHFDDTMSKVFGRVASQVQILAGQENPFSEACGMILGRYQLVGQSAGVLGVLGPVRMDYDRNLALIKFVLQNLNPEIN
ncbi:MAG: hypothetical protein WCW02_00255 [Candidatus Buchananbacteria bacterium]